VEPFLSLSLMKNLVILIVALSVISCESTHKGTENRITIPATPWRFTLNLNGHSLPFNGTFSNVEKRSATLTLRNADEKIRIDDVILRNDSVIAALPFLIQKCTSEWNHHICFPELGLTWIRTTTAFL